jgi:putative addiction module component (TIGR02574 family)
MTLKSIIDEARKLTVDEQLQLRDEIDRIVEGTAENDVALTPAQEADLDRRIDEYEAGKAKMIPGDEAIARVRRRD